MTKYAAMEAAAVRDGRIDRAALIKLVQAAMAAGLACATERMQSGHIDFGAGWDEIFGDFPDEFIDIRSSLVDALLSDRSDS